MLLDRIGDVALFGLRVCVWLLVQCAIFLRLIANRSLLNSSAAVS